MPTTGKAGYNDQFISGDLDIDIFQVIDSSSFDEYRIVFGHNDDLSA